MSVGGHDRCMSDTAIGSVYKSKLHHALHTQQCFLLGLNYPLHHLVLSQYFKMTQEIHTLLQ